MKPWRLFPIVLGAAALGCSLVTTWDELPLGAASGARDDDPAPGKDAGKSPRDRDEPDPPPVEEEEAGNPPNDAEAPVEGGDDPACPAGAYRCGDRVGGTANMLYLCTDGGTQAKWTCARGCVVVDSGGAGDRCNCFVGGRYCGTDQVVGDRNTLYECSADFSPTFLKKCANDCKINPGADDACL